jgi:ABC-type antimicrobial peptide transport system permease subunit
MVGLGGMLATSVRQRRREMGLRVALGAAPREVAAMVTREGTALVGIGAVVGLGIALLAADVLSSFVFGVGVRDPWTLLGTVALVLTLGLLTSWAQARRAASVDPVEALASD